MTRKGGGYQNLQDFHLGPKNFRIRDTSTQFEILYRTQLEILKLVIETKGDNNFSVPHTGIKEAVLKNHAQLMSRRKRKRYKTDPKVTN